MKFPGSMRRAAKRVDKYGVMTAREVRHINACIREEARARRAAIREQKKAERALLRLNEKARGVGLRQEKSPTQRYEEDLRRLQENETSDPYIAKLAHEMALNKALEDDIGALENILPDSLGKPVSFSFESFIKKKEYKDYLPPTDLIKPSRSPQWSEFVPKEPCRDDYRKEYIPPKELVEPLRTPRWEDFIVRPPSPYEYTIKPLGKFDSLLPWKKNAWGKKMEEATARYRAAQETYKENIALAKNKFEAEQRQHAEKETIRKQRLAEAAAANAEGIDRAFNTALEIYQEDLKEAKIRFEEAQKQHLAAEAERRQRLEEDRWLYELNKAKQLKLIDDENNELMQMKEEYHCCKKVGTISYFSGVLDSSLYPEKFPQVFELDYSPEARRITINYHLPSEEIIPKEKNYTYIKTKDELKVTERSKQEINNIYKSVVFSVALRTIYEVCVTDQNNCIHEIHFCGFVLTNQKQRLDLIIINIAKELFLTLDLTSSRPALIMKKIKADIYL